MNLKILRNNAGLTQQKAADLCGITLRSYQNYESESREMGYSTLIKLADYFGCSVDYLLGHQVNDITRPKEATMLQRQLCNDIMQLDEADCGRVEAYIEGIKAKNKQQEKIKKHFTESEVD